MYCLTQAPDFNVVELVRDSVLCHVTFRRSLASTRKLWHELGVRSKFEDECVLVMPDEQRVPFYDVNGCYLLPRWFDRNTALSASKFLRTAHNPKPMHALRVDPMFEAVRRSEMARHMKL